MKDGTASLKQFVELSAAVNRSLVKIWSNLEGPTAQDWIENGKTLEVALRQTLAPPDGIQFCKFQPVFKPWKTIKLGTGLQTADDFRRSLKQSGCKIGDWANDILGKRGFAVATKETEVDLVVVSVAELVFPNGATRQEIYQRAQQMGLELCPPEVGPQLRLQYKDQPNGDRLLIGMEPITGSGGNLGVFCVGRDDDELWLYGYDGYPDFFWHGYYRWVFLRRKPACR